MSSSRSFCAHFSLAIFLFPLQRWCFFDFCPKDALSLKQNIRRNFITSANPILQSRVFLWLLFCNILWQGRVLLSERGRRLCAFLWFHTPVYRRHLQCQSANLMIPKYQHLDPYSYGIHTPPAWLLILDDASYDMVTVAWLEERFWTKTSILLITWGSSGFNCLSCIVSLFKLLHLMLFNCLLPEYPSHNIPPPSTLLMMHMFAPTPSQTAAEKSRETGLNQCKVKHVVDDFDQGEEKQI